MKSSQSNFDLRSPSSYLARSYLIATVTRMKGKYFNKFYSTVLGSRHCAHSICRSSWLFNYYEVCRFKWCNHGAVCVSRTTLHSWVKSQKLAKNKIEIFVKLTDHA